MSPTEGTSSPALADWGWDEHWQTTIDTREGHDATKHQPARVIVVLRGVLTVATGAGTYEVRVPARFFRSDTTDPVPTVGDWVLIPASPAAEGDWITAVLPRRSLFSRKATGNRTDEQVLVANLDLLLLTTSFEGDLNARRLERYLVTARSGGADVVLLLNKLDLVDSAEHALAEIRTVAPDLRVIPTSTLSGEGIDDVDDLLRPGLTVALVGSSGVGKSSLANRLFGGEVMKTGGVRQSDLRGRHTTSHRQLLRMPSGALLVDNPGMRELSLWDASEELDDTFDDIVQLAGNCRFRNCTHTSEPGCAIAEALGGGTLDASRFESYLKLSQEAGEVAERRRERSRLDGKKTKRAIAGGKRRTRSRPSGKRKR